MLLYFENIIPPAIVKKARNILDEGQWLDGSHTAGREARKVKNNLELNAESDIFAQANNILMPYLMQNERFQQAALPSKIAAPIYSRYNKGMRYGLHVDDPIMGNNPKYRTDLSFTLFLSEPDEYEGGDLRIQTEFGEQKVRLGSGSVVLYPSSSLHEVEEVTGGTRAVVISWIESLIKSPSQRQILFQLFETMQLLTSTGQGDSPAYQKLRNTHANLVRMWSVT